MTPSRPVITPARTELHFGHSQKLTHASPAKQACMEQIDDILLNSGTSFSIEVAAAVEDIITHYLTSDRIQVTFSPPDDEQLSDSEGSEADFGSVQSEPHNLEAGELQRYITSMSRAVVNVTAAAHDSTVQ